MDRTSQPEKRDSRRNKLSETKDEKTSKDEKVEQPSGAAATPTAVEEAPPIDLTQLETLQGEIDASVGIVETLVAQIKTADEAGEDSAVKFMLPAMVDALRAKAAQCTDLLGGFPHLQEAVESITIGARKDGDHTLGVKVVPLSVVAIMGALTAEAAKPHKCPSCVCPPEKGVLIDPTRSELAFKAAEVELGEFPIKVGLLVGTGLSNPFAAPSKSGSGGTRSSTPRRELPDVGTVLTGKYQGEEHTAEIVLNAKSVKVVKYEGKEYASLSAAVQKGVGTHNSGVRFWNWEGK